MMIADTAKLFFQTYWFLRFPIMVNLSHLQKVL